MYVGKVQNVMDLYQNADDRDDRQTFTIWASDNSSTKMTPAGSGAYGSIAPTDDVKIMWGSQLGKPYSSDPKTGPFGTDFYNEVVSGTGLPDKTYSQIPGDKVFTDYEIQNPVIGYRIFDMGGDGSEVALMPKDPSKKAVKNRVDAAYDAKKSALRDEHSRIAMQKLKINVKC